MNQSLFSQYFKDKKVTKMGLGPNGRSFGDIVFLLQEGAHVLVTDHRDEPDIQTSKSNLLKQLSKEEKERVSFVLGEHRTQDFIDCDYVLKASGVPLDSEYIQAALAAGVPVHTSSAWLFQLVHDLLDVTTVGVTGTKGKSTTTDMIEHILKENNKSYHVAGNIRGVANLPVLNEIESGDILLAELDSWQLQGFGDAKVSPHIGVFTNFFEDHLNYYGGSMELYFNDKAQIYRNQKDLDICFVGKQAFAEIVTYEGVAPENIEDISVSVLPQDLELNVLGDHNRENAAFAYVVAQQIGLMKSDILPALESYRALEGRLRFTGERDGIYYYDDNNSTTPTSTIKSLQAIKVKYPGSRIIWFGGGADKESDYSVLISELSNLVYGGVLFAGTATDKIVEGLNENLRDTLRVVSSMDEAWKHVEDIKQQGDVIILSPGAASFGVFLNEYERGDQFNSYIKKLLN